MSYFGMDEEDDPLNPGMAEAPAMPEAGGMPSRPMMPNTPRDPDDPREKLRAYLEQRMASDQKMQTPEFRAADRAPAEALNQNNRELALAKLFNSAANQAGTIGGKAASSQGFDEYAGSLEKSNAQTANQISQQRQQASQDEDRTLKVQEYLSDRYGKDEMQRAALAKRADDRTYRTERDKVNDEFKRQQIASMHDKAGGTNAGLKALDQDYAKDYNDWTSIGKSGYDKNLKLLRDARTELAGKTKDSLVSGNYAGRMPDMFRTQDSKVIQQKVQAAAQGAMKAALGNAFTEKEGMRIMNLSYDPTLNPEQNLKKIDDAITDLEEKASNQEGKARYFEKNQTLKGYVSPLSAPAVPDTTKGGDSAGAPGLKPIDKMTREEKLKELQMLQAGG